MPKCEDRPRRISTCAAALAVSLAICACSSTRRPAPVVERTPPGVQAAQQAAAPAPAVAASQPDPRPEFYTVKKGDTLYTIALDHGLDYKELAALNSIGDVNVIRAGQQLRLRTSAGGAVATPFRSAPAVEARSVAGASPASPAGDLVKSQPKGVKVPYSEQAYAQLAGQAQASAPAQPPLQAQAKAAVSVPAKAEPRADERLATDSADDTRVDWGWPAGGKLASSFNETTNLKGIGISGRMGEAVHASAPGKVLYSGDGIRGYGKLVIIKHNKAFLSVYAHNSRLLVKEGQDVTKGQKIAEMGSSDADQVKLHFEIRRFGKPVDPIKFLPSEPPA